MMRKRLYTIRDIAKLLLRDEETVRRYCRTGKLKAQVIGGSYFITDANLKAFLGDDIYHGVIDTLPSLPADEQVGGGGK